MAKGIETVRIGEAWFGNGIASSAPLYSVVRVGDGYYFVEKNGLVPAKGFLCTVDVCFPVGKGVSVLAEGPCPIRWKGEQVLSPCPTLKVFKKPFPAS